jgi:hypothetical protein
MVTNYTNHHKITLVKNRNPSSNFGQKLLVKSLKSKTVILPITFFIMTVNVIGY